MAWLFRRTGSPFWWIAWTDGGGQRHRESTGIRHLEHKRPAEPALAVQRAIEERLSRAKFGLLAMVQPKPIAEFIADWRLMMTGTAASTVARYGAYLKTLENWCAAQKISLLAEVTYAVAARYVSEGLAERADTTVRCELLLFRRMWMEARKRSYCVFDESPWDIKVKCQERLRRPFSSDELQKLFGSDIPAWLRTVCWIALYTGARAETMRYLHAEHIGLDLGVVNFVRSKTGSYTVPLHPNLVEYLRTLKLSPGPIFPAEWGARGQSVFSNYFIRHLRKLGIKGSFHQFRHTFNSRLMECGVSRTEAMFLMNHKSEGVNAKYTHVEAVKMAPALAKLDYGMKIA